MSFAKTFLNILQNIPGFHKNCGFSDESHFDILPDTQGRILSVKKPALSLSGVQINRFPKRLTVWAAVHYKHGLIWFTNFTNAKGNYGNVDQFNYHECLSYFTDQLKAKFIPEQIGEMWFQQDGASAHTAFDNRAFLFRFFGERLIDCMSQNSNSLGIFWLPFSCDVNPCDYTL